MSSGDGGYGMATNSCDPAEPRDDSDDPIYAMERAALKCGAKISDVPMAGRRISFAPDQLHEFAGMCAPAWRPIESAPKDGSTILLRGIGDHRIGDGYWLQAAYNGNGGWIWAYVRSEPFRWMPIPVAHEDQEEK